MDSTVSASYLSDDSSAVPEAQPFVEKSQHQSIGQHQVSEGPAATLAY